MWIKLFFYEKESSWENIKKEIMSEEDNFQVLTDNEGLSEFLNQKNIESSTYENTIRKNETNIKEIDRYAKEILNQYRRDFENIKFLDYNFFRGFDYILLRQLIFLSQIKTILENKKNTILVFEGFLPIYFAILEQANLMNYETDKKIKWIRKNGTEIFSDSKEDIQKINNAVRIKKILKNNNSSKEVNSFSKINKIVSISKKGLSFYLNRAMYNFKNTEKAIEEILNQIDKKIFFDENKKEISSLFFLTAGAREDLFIKPLIPIFDEFKKEGKSYQVITGDFLTGSLLLKMDVSHVNLFQEVNIVADLIKKTDSGKEIKKTIRKIAERPNSPFGIKAIIQDILEKTFRSLAILRIGDYIMKKIHPKSIFSGVDGEMLENLMVEVAKKYEIPNFSYVHTIFTPNPMFSEWFHAESIFAYGGKAKDVLEKLGYSSSRIIISGHPKYDFLNKLNPDDSKKMLSKKFGLDSSKKLILIGMSKWYVNDDVWLSDFIQFCKNEDFEIIIKVHPMYKIASKEFSEKIIQKIKEKSKKLKFTITIDFDVYTILSAADLVITDFSNLGIEAALLQKPLLIFKIEENPSYNYLELEKFNVSKTIDDFSELKKITKEILQNGEHLEEFEKDRENAINYYNFKNDGNSSKRIFDELIRKK